MSAYGGVFRKDGNLLVAGSEDGFLRLFEMKNHKQLRVFKGHRAATHRCNFTVDGVNLVSFSDDRTVSLWDMPSEKRMQTFEEHRDYIRAGAVSQASKDIIVSGSYDHSVKMYDARTGSSVMTLSHGAPVESLLMIPSGGILISAGGFSVKVWDPVAGRLLTEVTQHHKAVTCLCLASGGRRLVSGSLDRNLKIYDINTYEVVHTLKYSSPILSVAVATDDKAIGVGMTDGIFSLKQRKPTKEKETKKNTFYKYRLYGTDFKETDVHSHVVPSAPSKQKFKRYENHLRKFESTSALDVTLRDNRPEHTVTVLMELIRRGSIRSALSFREGDSLWAVTRFVAKYIGDPRYMRILIDVGLILIEVYGSQMSDPEIKRYFRKLRRSVQNQIEYMDEMMEAQGVIQTILATTYIQEEQDIILSRGQLPEVTILSP